MKKLVAALAVAAAIVALTVGPAGAVQFGQPDNGEHPYVGLMVAYDSNWVVLWRCSGTLISSHRFLTAGHCTGFDPATGATPAHAQVWFDEGPIVPGDYPGHGASCAGYTGYPCTGGFVGTPHPEGQFTGFLTLPNTHDIGMVVLDQAVTDKGYGQLADEGTLDSLARQRGLQDLSIQIVGYGLQSVKPALSGVRVRLKATTTIESLGSAITDGYNVRISSDPGLGNGPGGVCFGDSGGPLLYKGEIVAVNSFGLNKNCRGSSYGYRTDTEESLGFIDGFAP